MPRCIDSGDMIPITRLPACSRGGFDGRISQLVSCPRHPPPPLRLQLRNLAAACPADKHLARQRSFWRPRPCEQTLNGFPPPMPAPIRDDGLNDAQRAAAEHGEGPLLVIAGAGSGKTNTLAHRVAHLVLSGVDPKRIMLATFSRRAAAELNRRVERLAAARSRAGGRRRGDAGLRRYVPRHRRAAPARIRRADRPRREFHHPRSRG